MNDNVFVRRDPAFSKSYDIINIYRRRFSPVKGDVGIEVEVEGNKFPKPSGYAGTSNPKPLEGVKYWSYVHDGSLRGQDNAEYVLTKPISFNKVPEAVDELTKTLNDFGSKLNESNRTSVHVHLNCQKFHLNRLASFCALYFCTEEILAEWCGDHRVGNLFCLRGKDAPAIVTKISQFIEHDGRTELSQGLHYAGLNAYALYKLGSLEVRLMRGPTDLSIIKDWVSILERLYKLSEEFKDPREIVGQFSSSGPMGFFEFVFGDLSPLVMSGISLNEERLRDSLYEGIRIAQDICYCRDWDLFRPFDMKSDPFGRRLGEETGAPASPSLHTLASQYSTYSESPSVSASIPPHLLASLAPALDSFDPFEQTHENLEPDF